jgi:hypothetical protein
MKRRNFLGFLGGAAVAGPSAAKAAVSQVGMAGLAPIGINLASGSGKYSGAVTQGIGATYSHVEYARSALKSMMSLTDAAKEHRKREHYFQGLDPDTASLRSLSLTSKIKLAKERSFEASERKQRSHLQGIIDGLWE